MASELIVKFLLIAECDIMPTLMLMKFSLYDWELIKKCHWEILNSLSDPSHMQRVFERKILQAMSNLTLKNYIEKTYDISYKTNNKNER